MKACVIGAGVIGCAVALELQRRGFRSPWSTRTATPATALRPSSCGIVRRFYAQPGMIAMAHEGAQIWADWDAFLGPIDDEKIVFHRPGMLFIPPRLDAGVHATVAEMKKLGVDVSILSPHEIAERFPLSR